MDEMPQEPKVALDLKGTRIDLELLLEAVNAFFGILRDVDSMTTRKSGGAFAWNVTDLAGGSAHIEVVAVSKGNGVPPGTGRLVVKHFAEGMLAIRAGGGRPTYFTNQGLRQARKLTSLVRDDGFAEIIIRVNAEAIRMDREIARHVDALIEGTLLTIGSVEGDLKMVSLAGQTHFNVYDAVTGSPLRCNFPPAMLDQVRTALGQRVVVHGTFTSKPGAEPSNMRVEELEVLPDSFELPTVEDVRGILKHA
ncbi:hypothetical protein BH23GEM4_BH23GEM4_06780 [soil metagenome]